VVDVARGLLHWHFYNDRPQPGSAQVLAKAARASEFTGPRVQLLGGELIGKEQAFVSAIQELISPRTMD